MQYATVEEAIAAALAELTPGGLLRVHSESCEQHGEDERACTCAPLELVVGAEA